MAMLQNHYMRISYVGVLINLVRIVGRDTTLGSERELCDDVYNLRLLAILCCFIFLLRTCASIRLWIVARVLFARRL